MSAKIIATGSYAPPHIVTNRDYESVMETNDAWIQQRTGIKTRHFEAASTAHMATEAAKKALAGIDLETIDCIIVGTYTPDSFIPGVGNQVRANLSIPRPIPAFDINAACSGFIYALQTGNAYIAAGMYQRILVIGVDYNSRVLNYEDRATAILFGDGAGAVVLEKGENGLQDTILGGEWDKHETLLLPNHTKTRNPFLNQTDIDASLFAMKGSDVFKFAVRILEQSVLTLLERNNLELKDIDYIISHQANQRILDMVARSLKVDPSVFLSNVAEYGNTSSGSVPLLLDESHKNGTLKAGMNVILVAFGGGLSYGASLIKW